VAKFQCGDHLACPIHIFLSDEPHLT
jgi:hypothetical protein